MENKKKGKVLSFFKKYGYYVVALALILGITLSVALSANPSKTNPEDSTPTDSTPIVFALPLNSPEVLKWYSDSELMYNDTLKQWESHKGVDMKSSSDDLSVYSVLDGVVTNIEDTYEFGTVLTITHENGFVSVYSSLETNLNVNISDKVKKGQKVGNVSDTATNEQQTGNHLHFELYKDGQKVDPSNYLSLENK